MDILKIKLALSLHGLQIHSDVSIVEDYYARIEPIGYYIGMEIPDFLLTDNGSRYKYFDYGNTKEEASYKVYQQWISRNSTSS
jgi:hypothetical protein